MAHPGGRPSDYRPEYCEIARKLLKDGYCMTEIAYDLDVNITTLKRWIANFPEFRSVIEEDKSFSEGWWLKEGKANLANGKYNTRMYELQMMNRFGWKKNQESNHDVKISETQEKIRNAEQQY